MAREQFGLQVDDLRLLAGMGDALQKDGEEFAPEARFIDVEGRELGVARLGFGKVIEADDQDVARDAFADEFEGLDDRDGDGIVGGDEAIGEGGHARKQPRELLGSP